MRAVFGRQRGAAYWASLNGSCPTKKPRNLSFYVFPGRQELDGCRCREVYHSATRGQCGHIVTLGHMKGQSYWVRSGTMEQKGNTSPSSGQDSPKRPTSGFQSQDAAVLRLLGGGTEHPPTVAYRRYLAQNWKVEPKSWPETVLDSEWSMGPLDRRNQRFILVVASRKTFQETKGIESLLHWPGTQSLTSQQT